MIGITNGNGGSAGAANNVVGKNLLDNWYFAGGGSQQGGSQLPINQRGLTSYSVNGYTIDRWRTNFSNDTVTVESTSVKCLNASTSVGWHLHQIISDMDELIGATVTASFFVVGVQGTKLKPIISFRNSSDTEISSINLTSNPTTGVISLTGVVPANTSKIRVGFYASSGIASGDYIQVSAVKFEVGGTQTLAHYDSANSVWVLNEVPNYQEQLFRCQTSTADPTDTYANQPNLVGFQVRPNLIDNWYFVGGGSQQGEGYLPINQRGQTSYSGAIAYTIDRWKTSNTNTTVTVSSAGLTLSAVTGTTPYLLQPLGNIEKLRGKTVTASFLIGNQLYSKTDVFPVNDPSDISAICGISQVGQILYMSGAWFMRLIGSIASSNPYIAVKFEVGNSQTLAHWDSVNGAWVLNEVPNYEEQLFRCQTANADVTTDNYANKENLVGFQVRPNLLDNWYFVGGGSQQGGGQFPINQRGSTSYSAGAYSIDRWYNRQYTTASLVSNGLKLELANTGGYPFFTQRLENYQDYLGKTVTVSVMIAAVSANFKGVRLGIDTSSSVSTNSYTWPQTSTFYTTPGVYSVTVTLPDTIEYSGLNISLYFGANNRAIGDYCVISAVKLELGDTQTLAHQENGVWVLNEIPNFEEQLYRCKMSTADTSDTYANNNKGFLPMSGGRLTGRLYTDGGITMPTGFTSNGLGTVDLTANTYTAGANGHVLAAKFKSEDGSQTHTTYPISIIGTSNTTSNYNSGVRLGSINGTTIVSAGESGSTFAAANAKFDDENLYLVADNQVLLYKAANDGTVSLGPLVVAGFGATPTSGQVVVTSGTAGDIRSSGYAVNSSGGIPSYQYSTTDLTAGTSSLTTGRLYFVYE